MLSLIVSLLGLSPSTNLYLSKATAHCANATLEPCSYTLYINHDTDNPGVLPVLPMAQARFSGSENQT